jgi:hypothetical protein
MRTESAGSDDTLVAERPPTDARVFSSLGIQGLKQNTRRQAVSTRFVDFWLLGGASIVLWGVMLIGQYFRESSEAIESHFVQVGAFFSMMSIFCNHPHFMISYRFGYGRGWKFIRQHWFKLILVPLGLIAMYAIAYINYNAQISETPLVIAANHLFEKMGWAFRLGTLNNLGTEILSLSVLLMYMTVGWHYSKQVFGCIMVYARYDQYPISRFQRALLKLNLFGIAFLNFFYISIYAPEYHSASLAQNFFFNIPLISLGLPKFLIPLSAVWVGVSAVATIALIFYSNFKLHKRRPSLNLIVPWIAFHIWWIPLLRLPEYYFLAVPFFHSLQYLPFAYRLESPKIKNGKFRELNLSLRLAALLFIGFCAFELVPSLLDKGLETTWFLKTWFFMIAFAVFINVHHFFIDSVVWKFDQSDIKGNLLR